MRDVQADPQISPPRVSPQASYHMVSQRCPVLPDTPTMIGCTNSSNALCERRLHRKSSAKKDINLHTLRVQLAQPWSSHIKIMSLKIADCPPRLPNYPKSRGYAIFLELFAQKNTQCHEIFMIIKGGLKSKPQCAITHRNTTTKNLRFTSE